MFSFLYCLLYRFLFQIRDCSPSAPHSRGETDQAQLQKWVSKLPFWEAILPCKIPMPEREDLLEKYGAHLDERATCVVEKVNLPRF